MSVFRNRNLKARLTQPADELWDRRLGVQTFGHHPGSGKPGDREWYMHYIPSSYRDVFDTLGRAGLGPDDVVTDLGSGLGRVVFAAAWAGARRAEGVELIEWLAKAAEANRARSTLKDRDIRFIHSDARAHDFTQTTLLYMFHPFGDAIVGEVLEKARADRRKAGSTQPLRLAYVNPVANAVLEQSGWLRHVETVPAMPQRWSSADHYETSFWQSID